MNREEAEEFTQALGQNVSANWRFIEWGKRQGVPEALGLTVREWAEGRLGGYIRLAVEDRREAALELTASESEGGKGLSQREAADVLGVSPMTITRDLADPITNVTAEPEPESLDQAKRSDPITNVTAEDEDEDEDEPREPRKLPKKVLATGVSHPAPFPHEVLEQAAKLLEGCWTVLDPFAGTGGIHKLREHGYETVGVELEEEWAALSPHTVLGNALALPFPDREFDAICTSPTYGNRLADHHKARDPESRSSYTHDLGRPLHADNSGAMHWGDAYRTFHLEAWREASRVLRPRGRFVLNVKDSLEGDNWHDVAGWHVGTLEEMGYRVRAIRPIITSGLRRGSNADKRAEAELVIAMEKL